MCFGNTLVLQCKIGSTPDRQLPVLHQSMPVRLFSCSCSISIYRDSARNRHRNDYIHAFDYDDEHRCAEHEHEKHTTTSRMLR